MKAKKLRRVTYRSTDGRGEPIPLIPIQGKFLTAMGFGIGSMVEVKYGDGFVHISRILRERYGSPGDYAPIAVKR